MTAETNNDTPLSERTSYANRNNADIFVSIHANAYGTTWNTANGWEIFVYSKDNAQYELAKCIEEKSIPYLGLKNRGIKENNSLYVLRNTKMAAVLIEHGFYTNKEELAKLKNDSFREMCAIADSKGILSYFGIEWKEDEAGEGVVEEDMITKTKIKINNKEYEVDRILYKDKNYVELRSFEQAGFNIQYNSVNKVPSINCPDVPLDYSYKKDGEYHILEVEPMKLDIIAVNKNLNELSENNLINSGYFITQKVNGAYPISMAISNGKYLKYSNTELADNVPHKKAAGTFIVYKNGTVDVKPVIVFGSGELNNIKFAVGGLTILPSIRTVEEGFHPSTSEDGKDYTDVIRATKRVVIGYNKTKNKVIILASDNMSALEASNKLKELGCEKGITLDAGGSATLKVEGKYLISSDGRRQFSYITF